MTTKRPPGNTDRTGGTWASNGEYDTDLLSRPDSKTGRLQRALLERLHVHERENTLPTSAQFLRYELIQAGVVPKARTGARLPHQDLIDALTILRDRGVIPWRWISDETRNLTRWKVARTIAEYVLRAVDSASLDPWQGKPPPLIICESRSLAGVLHDIASRYAAPITSVNGQCKGHLIGEVAPALKVNQRVLYFGDLDYSGGKIEENTCGVLKDHAPLWAVSLYQSERRARRHARQGTGDTRTLWERLALTAEQVEEYRLPVISKRDKRFRGGRYFDAVETEALSQRVIVDILTARLDELLPEPLPTVHERAERQRAEIHALLAPLLSEGG